MSTLESVDIKQPITLTQSAVEQLQGMVSKNDLFIRLHANPSGCGCSGMSYSMAVDNAKKDTDREFTFGPVKVLVQESNLEHISGAVLDYINDETGEGFVLDQPEKEKGGGGCGCGCN